MKESNFIVEFNFFLFFELENFQKEDFFEQFLELLVKNERNDELLVLIKEKWFQKNDEMK